MKHDDSELMSVRRQKVKDLRSAGLDPFRAPLKPKHRAADIHLQYADYDSHEEGDEVVVAGRLMLMRDFGKAAFLQIQDSSGTLQLYAQKAKLGDTVFAGVKNWDLGDWIWGRGRLFRTKTKELTVLLHETALLTKSIRPLPEKYHGLTDIELRYRQRYLDLTMNPVSRQVFQNRSRIISWIRHWLQQKGFLEVETPMMQAIAGGAQARPFETHHHALNMPLFLRIAPELYLKRLLVGGFERVFEINRNFRNEGISVKHNPEFTMLELYAAFARMEDLMDLAEEMIQGVMMEIHQKTAVEYQGELLDFGGKWTRITVEESLLKWSGVEKEALLDETALRAYLTKKGIHTQARNRGELWMEIFDHEVESKLRAPTFVTEYPVDVSPLAKKSEKNPFIAERFELFIAGREVGNAFNELNDPEDQLSRFEEQAARRATGDMEASSVDYDYITALEHGCPPSAGLGIGIDRLVMLLTDAPSIRDVILFPVLRPSDH